MALFRRNTDEDTVEIPAVPEEVQTYYQEEKRERKWLAWLLALGTLLATVLITLGLFYGGRYVYRKLRPADKPVAVNVQEEASKPGDNKSEDNKSNETPAATPSTPSQAASGANPSSSPQAATSPTSQTSSTNTTQSNSDAGKVSGTTLPDTGSGDILAIFAVTSVVAYLIHRRFQTI